MNKTIIFSAVGFASGVVIGFFIGKKMTEKKANDRADNEIEEMKTYYQTRRNDISREKRPVETTIPEKPSPSEVMETHKDFSNYKNYASSYDRDHTDEEEPTMAKLEPKIITAEEFGELPNYDTAELLYFPEEGSLQNEAEEEIDDAESVLGNGMKKYGFEDNDEEDLFVRNFRDQTDYHVKKVW